MKFLKPNLLSIILELNCFLCNRTFCAGTYDAVIVCLGAKMIMLPQLTGKLPLRTCRGVVAHFQLHDDIRYRFFDNLRPCGGRDLNFKPLDPVSLISGIIL